MVTIDVLLNVSAQVVEFWKSLDADSLLHVANTPEEAIRIARLFIN